MLQNDKIYCQFIHARSKGGVSLSNPRASPLAPPLISFLSLSLSLGELIGAAAEEIITSKVGGRFHGNVCKARGRHLSFLLQDLLHTTGTPLSDSRSSDQINVICNLCEEMWRLRWPKSDCCWCRWCCCCVGRLRRSDSSHSSSFPPERERT